MRSPFLSIAWAWWWLPAIGVAAGWGAPLRGQEANQGANPTASGAMSGCPHIPTASPPTEAKRQAARDFAARGEQASIMGDNVTARDLFRRAVQLDPTDANTVYALARVEDATRESRAAVAAYCRFLALTPGAPEADGVRGRVASLLLNEGGRARSVGKGRRLPPDERPPTVVASAPSPSAASASAGVSPGVSPRASLGAPPDRGAFLLATVVPGLGQYDTHRPIAGALVTAATVGALYYGFEPQTVTTRGPGSRTETTHPHLAAGLITAGVISTLAAMEASVYASKQRRSSPVVLDVSPSHVGFWVPVALQGRLAVGATLGSRRIVPAL